MSNPVIAYAKAHPIPVAAGVVVVGLGLLYLLNAGSAQAAAASSGSGSSGADAYFAAASAQAQAGDAVQIAQIQGQTAATETLLNDQTSVANATTWSGAQTTQALNTNATAVDLAPYGVESAAISGLSTAATVAPITTTTQSANSGFFGIGASSGTTTAVTPSPVASAAVDELDQYLNGFAPAH